MTELSKYSNDISELCSQHNVKYLYAFGSVLTPAFNENSDVDFIVDFEPIDIAQYADNYYELKFSLEDLLHKRVDLLEDKALKNPYFRQAIDKQRQLIYGN